MQLLEVLTTDYLARPLLALVLLSVVGAVVGGIVNLRCAEFRAETMVHAVFPGIVGGFVVGGTDSIIIGAGIAAVITAFVLVFSNGHQDDAATAVVLASFYSVGIVVSLYFSDKSGQLEALMFGRLLEMSDTRLWQCVLICVGGLVMMGATWARQVYVAFDRQAYADMGGRQRYVDLCLNLAIAAVVVAASSVVGVLLAVGFLVVPSATARIVARSPGHMCVMACVAGVLGSCLGYAAMLSDSPRPISPQAAVALGQCAVFALVAMGFWVWRWRR